MKRKKPVHPSKSGRIRNEDVEERHLTARPTGSGFSTPQHLKGG